jgi:hypothetical protein
MFQATVLLLQEVGGLFCFKGRGKAVLSIVARRRAVRARGSLDVRRWQALIQGQGCRGASLADVCSTMSSSHSWGQVSSVASQSFGAMGFSLICVFRKGRGLGLVRLFFFSRILCSSLVERLFPLYPLHMYLCLYGFLDF